jgi:hypothetical protein
MARENPLVFYPRTLWEIVSKHARFAGMYWRYRRTLRRVQRDNRPYSDLAMTPAQSGDVDALELFSATQGGRKAAEQGRRRLHSGADNAAAVLPWPTSPSAS